MSKAYNFYDFKREAESWVAAFGAADHLQRKNFYDELKKQFGRLKYLNIQKCIVTTKDSPMLDVLSEFSVTMRHADLVKIDFANVWSQFVVGDQVGAHFIDTVDAGFEFNFALRSRNDYCIVGRFQVHAKRSD